LNQKRKKRLIALSLMVLGVATSVYFILFALNKNINLYLTPTQVVSGTIPDRVFRVGGLVTKNSIHRVQDTLTIQFTMTDLVNSIPVVFTGVTPALFREGQGVVVEGKFNSKGIFVASQVLAKHDEKYMPPGIKKNY
jgi:cytochrome c-type biogenesis protein CcmE